MDWDDVGPVAVLIVAVSISIFLITSIFLAIYKERPEYQCGQVFEEYTRKYYYCIEYLEQDKHMGEIIDELKGE